jgi:hypothetical protein
MFATRIHTNIPTSFDISVSLSIGRHVTYRKPLNGFSWNSVLKLHIKLTHRYAVRQKILWIKNRNAQNKRVKFKLLCQYKQPNILFHAAEQSLHNFFAWTVCAVSKTCKTGLTTIYLQLHSRMLFLFSLNSATSYFPQFYKIYQAFCSFL